MTAKKKIDTWEAAVQTAHEAHLQTIADRDDATVELETARNVHADLTRRNEDGDRAVTGLDLVTAEAEVTRHEGLLNHAENNVETAAAAYAEAVASQVANDPAVAENYPAAIEASSRALAVDLADLIDNLVQLYADRDQLSDTIGARLAAAGVPWGTELNGMKYWPVSRQNDAGQGYDVQIGGTRIVHRRHQSGTRQEVARVVRTAIETALAYEGYKWTSTGLDRRSRQPRPDSEAAA